MSKELEEAIKDAIKYEKEEIKYSTDEYRSKMHVYTLNVLEELLEVQNEQ